MNAQYYIAVITEKTSPLYNKVIANTKNGQYKNYSKSEFSEKVKASTCWAVEVKEITTPVS